MNTIAPLLDQVAEKGERWLLRSRLRDGVKAGLRPALFGMVFVAFLLLLAGLAHRYLGAPAPRLGLGTACCFLVPLAVLGFRVLMILREHPTREEGLALFDERLALRDRLRTADGFMQIERPTAFMRAAVADALPAAQRAAEKELHWAWNEGPSSVPRWLVCLPVLAIALLLVAWWMPKAALVIPPGSSDPEGGAAPQTVVSQAEKEDPEAVERPDLPPKRRPAETKPVAPPQGPPPTVSEPNVSAKVVEDQEVKETEGMTEGGQHSDARSSGRSDRSQGAPGNQSPASKPVEQKKPAKKSVKKEAKEREPSPQKKKVKDRSGATSGRGSSSGSSRNPASTDWSSKDRVEESEDQDMEQEEEVDDEETESEARGGLQPNLRDRRPPVNRDLSIGFGNRSNPDANGRGGPGQRKKSRGVASLVLGVPVPDHVKGQVNPGRVKITQERIQPKAEQAEPASAQDRGTRQAPIGTIPQRSLDPEMKQLVREFFLRED